MGGDPTAGMHLLIEYLSADHLLARICMDDAGSCEDLDSCLLRSRPLIRGLSWGAGGLILLAAAWAIVQNAGYGPLLKVKRMSLQITSPQLH